MNKKEIIIETAAKASVSKKEALKVVDAFLGVIGDVLEEGGEASIPDFGKFKENMKNPIMANGISFATSGADVGTAQNPATASAMPRKQNTHVRCVRLPKMWSLAQPAASMPKMS